MSLHMPDHVRSIRAHQESLANIQAWWPATKQAPPVMPSTECTQLFTMLRSGDLTQKICAAMDEQFSNNDDALATADRIKTSESHPIK